MTGWFVYSVYFAFVLKEQRFKNIIAMLITGYLIMAIKPYIIVALVPGAFIWLAWSYIRKNENILLRVLLGPVTTILFLAFGVGILAIFQRSLGTYGSIDGIINKALVTYDDHTRAYAYGENFYDLGEFDGTMGNFFSKAPLAIFTGLFRPLLWEARNPFMLLAALENLAFLLLVFVIFWRTGIVKTIKIAFDEPLVVFALSFAIVFAFGVGISSGNFGALVRLKIPLLPFLAAGLFTLYRRSTELKKEKENQESRAFIQARQVLR
jgi:predicted membrane protein